MFYKGILQCQYPGFVQYNIDREKDTETFLLTNY